MRRFAECQALSLVATHEVIFRSYNRLFRCRFSRPLDTETFLPASQRKGQVFVLKGHPIRVEARLKGHLIPRADGGRNFGPVLFNFPAFFSTPSARDARTLRELGQRQFVSAYVETRSLVKE